MKRQSSSSRFQAIKSRRRRQLRLGKFHVGSKLIATALVAMVVAGQAGAAPTDIMNSAAPDIGADAPKGNSLKSNEASVSPQTGALQFSFPLTLPPHRGNAAPIISLSYSSQAPIYGDIAAGWTLGIPAITHDPSISPLRVGGQVDADAADPRSNDRFVSSLAGNRPLVAITEAKDSFVYQTYRAQNDTSFARYERMQPTAPGGARWRMRSSDGTTMLFGEPNRGCAFQDNWSYLTTIIDAYGNQVDYTYVTQPQYKDCLISKIEYGRNVSAGLPHHVFVDFAWAGPRSCDAQIGTTTRSPIGGQQRLFPGPTRTTGASPLTQITITTDTPGPYNTVSAPPPEHVRTLTITNATPGAVPSATSADLSICTGDHAPYRQITAIEEKARHGSGADAILPPTTFSYASASIIRTTPWSGSAHGPLPQQSAGTRARGESEQWPSVERLLIDFDGDGRPDELAIDNSPSNTTSCTVNWRRNTPTGMAAPVSFNLPRLPWTNGASKGPKDRCALNGQLTFVDNGAVNASCVNGASPRNSGSYLVYRWMDLDGDARPDLVTAIHNDSDKYDPLLGTFPLSPVPSCTGARPPACWSYQRSVVDNGLLCGGSGTHNCRLNYGLFTQAELTPGDAKPVGCWAHSSAVAKQCSLGPNGRHNNCGADSRPGACGTPLPPLPEGSILPDDPPTCLFAEDPVPPENCDAPRAAFQLCTPAKYPWWIYQNNGDGTFAPPRLVMQDIALEVDGNDSNLMGAPNAASQGIVDIDGDGHLDAVVGSRNDPTTDVAVSYSELFDFRFGAVPHTYDEMIEYLYGRSPHYWQVLLGDGRGEFVPRKRTSLDAGAYKFQTPPFAELSLSDYVGPNSGDTHQGAMLADINGDGLPDYVALEDVWDHKQREFGGDIHVGFNFGLGTDYGEDGLLPSVSQSHTEAVEYEPLNGFPDNAFVNTGFRESWSRLVDVDADGRPDMARRFDAPIEQWRVHLNLGGSFGNQGTLPAISRAAANRVATNRLTSNQWLTPIGISVPTSSWETKADFIDLNGDGISEAYDAINGTKTHVVNGAPPRLMTSINNGRGAVTSINYISVHDPLVTSSNPTLYRTPNAMWMVKDLTVTDSWAGTTTTTSREYKDPVFSPEPAIQSDDPGKWSFRGFREVVATGPTGAKTVSRFQYGGTDQPDWSGRLIESLVFPAETPTKVLTIDRTTYEHRYSFGIAITTYHPVTASKFVCKANQTESECRDSPDSFRKTTTQYSSFGDGASIEMWAPTEERTQGPASRTNSALAAGDRYTTTSYSYSNTGGTGAITNLYRLRPIAIASFAMVDVGGTLVAEQFGKSEQDWDASLNHVLVSRNYFDSTNFAATKQTYDVVGNVVEQWQPKYFNTTTRTVLTYDPLKLFVASETNEIGQVIETATDYGTGAVLSTRGPNIATCTVNCSGPLKEESSQTIDGFGRPLETFRTASDSGDVYTLIKTGEMAYFDNVAGQPSKVVSKKVIEMGAPAMTEEVAEFDGAGRLTRTISRSNGAAPFDAVTSYVYGNDGKLIRVNTPDPTQNTAATVATEYEFDSIGRPTKMLLPDHTSVAQRSGVLMEYAGSSTTTTEIVGAADKSTDLAGNVQPAGATRTYMDAFGRVTSVLERRASAAAGSNEWSTTQYTYRPRDEVATITDPQGIATTLTHDWSGRRTQIVRAGKTWVYTYDLNGNMESERVPVPAGALVGDYTNLMTYDPLNRMLTRSVGKRALSTADEALFGSKLYTYTWDFGGNRAGRIRYVGVFAPGATQATIALDYNYDAFGNRTNTSQTLRVAGFPALNRQFNQTFTPNFGVRMTRFRDTIGGSETSTQTLYDARGMPRRLDLIRTGQSTQQIAVQTRNVAGLVTKRRTDQLAATGSMPFIESNWVYDTLGRPVSQTVQRSLAATPTVAEQVAKQQLSYWGTGDPKQMVSTLGTTNAKTFDYKYDPRHQLIEAKSGAAGATYLGEYRFGDPLATNEGANPGKAGRLTRVKVGGATGLPGSEVKPRDVNYVYGSGGATGVDAEAVVALANVTGGGNFAEYQYDLAGNQTRRWYAAGDVAWEYVYDGEDQLRRVVKKTAGVTDGSEEYWYDESGGRVAIVYRDASGTKTGLRWFIGATEAYYTAGGAGANTATLERVYSHPSLGTPVARVDRTGAGAAGNVIEYQFHGMGSHTMAAVSSAGVVNTSFVYAPYGEVVEAVDAGGSVGAAKHRRRITDKYVDEIGGLHYFGARYYDNVMIGWTQADPLYRFVPDKAWVDPRKANLYQYVMSNPLSYVDPDGRNPLSWGAGLIGGAVGGAVGFVSEAANQVAEWDFDGGALVDSTVSNAAGGAAAGVSVSLGQFAAAPGAYAVTQTAVSDAINWRQPSTSRYANNVTASYTGALVWSGVAAVVGRAAAAAIAARASSRTVALDTNALMRMEQVRASGAISKTDNLIVVPGVLAEAPGATPQLLAKYDISVAQSTTGASVAATPIARALRDFGGPRAVNSARSDALILADSAAAGAHIFLTQDKGILATGGVCLPDGTRMSLGTW